MTRQTAAEAPAVPLRFVGGTVGALLPFVLFLTGVAWLALSGAPDERGFWPILLAALALGVALAHDRRRYCDTVIHGMSQPIVLLMILAWLLAGAFAALLRASGLVEALIWLAQNAGLSGGAFVVGAFFVCCAVSTATGTSLGTLFLCLPLLYPAGVALGADPAVLVGAILGGATFGDNISPVSDTTIASATTQGADLGGVVKSRMRYALPAAAVAFVAYAALGGTASTTGESVATVEASPRGLVMLLAPALIIFLLIRKRHLIEGLLTGIVAAVVLGIASGLLAPSEILYIDHEHFGARGLLISGMERGIGISVFTLLLMGLVAGLEASGLLERLLAYVEVKTEGPRGAELWTFATMSAATLLTTHTVVAILAVGPFARRTGERFGINPYRRSNLLDVTGCTYPFLLPYCIPTVLAASLTAMEGMPKISPLTAGMHNFHSWALMGILIIAIATGYGRGKIETER